MLSSDQRKEKLEALLQRVQRNRSRLGSTTSRSLDTLGERAPAERGPSPEGVVLTPAFSGRDATAPASRADSLAQPPPAGGHPPLELDLSEMVEETSQQGNGTHALEQEAALVWSTTDMIQPVVVRKTEGKAMPEVTAPPGGSLGTGAEAQDFDDEPEIEITYGSQEAVALQASLGLSDDAVDVGEAGGDAYADMDLSSPSSQVFSGDSVPVDDLPAPVPVSAGQKSHMEGDVERPFQSVAQPAAQTAPRPAPAAAPAKSSARGLVPRLEQELVQLPKRPPGALQSGSPEREGLGASASQSPFQDTLSQLPDERQFNAEDSHEWPEGEATWTSDEPQPEAEKQDAGLSHAPPLDCLAARIEAQSANPLRALPKRGPLPTDDYEEEATERSPRFLQLRPLGSQGAPAVDPPRPASLAARIHQAPQKGEQPSSSDFSESAPLAYAARRPEQAREPVAVFTGHVPTPRAQTLGELLRQALSVGKRS